jgi:propionyl-CoA carboxylase beta chain
LTDKINALQRQLETASDAATQTVKGEYESKLKEKEAEYTRKFANPYRAANRGFVDEIILPQDTRRKLINAFEMLKNKAVPLPKKKHGNVPL